MSENYDIIVSGHLCLDMIPEMDKVPLDELASPGHLFEIGPLTLATGGAVSNTGLALDRLGLHVGLMTMIGDDMIGQSILSVIESRGKYLSNLIQIKPGHSSSYTLVLSPGRADRIFLHYTGLNNTFGIKNMDFDAISRTRIFHIGYPPLLPQIVANDGEELTEAFRKAHALGVATSLDMTLPDAQSVTGRMDWVKILRNALPHVDIFIPSIEEIIFMLRRADFDRWRGSVLSHITHSYLVDLADELIGMGVAIAGFKLGEMGFYIKTAPAARIQQINQLKLDANAWGAVEHWEPTFEVEVVSTVGAGDAAYAGFLTALLRGLSPQEAVTWACALGASNVETADAISGVKPWDETARRIQAGWQQKTLRIPEK
ncbi:MAG: carbohydrate kinase family protein [Anaerolineae bacterium]|nr:carbohydrate kinase family protein [Anaerolineae bacterium]